MKCFGERIRNYHCKVILLDNQELIQEIQTISLGQDLLENIFKHLNLIETSYFGLRFIDSTDQTHWLDPGKKTIKQLEDLESFTLYFGVKFYATDPCKLVEEITRYQFFLQIKQDILQGRLLVPNELLPELCAYAVQSELGDFDQRRHGTGYVSEFQFTSTQSPELENKIGDLHKSMIGQVPAMAELNYLEKVKWLEMYGVDLHAVLGEDNTDYFLGLTPAGVIVLRTKTKVGNYFWPRITKMNQKGKYFMLRVKNKNNEEQTYGFETPSKAACKHLWRCATEHHTFFRLLQLPSTSSKSLVLSTRFRDSGRSEYSVRRRAQPQFVRTPSRRYQRRIVEGAQADAEPQDEVEVSSQASLKRIITGASKPVESSILLHTSSPKSTRSASWAVPTPKNSVPSPKSARSAGVGSAHGSNREKTSDRHHHRSRRLSGSVESQSSGDSQSNRRHRHRRRSRRSSDVESEASRNSGRSHGKRRHHRSSGSRQGESGSDSETCRKHRHRHRKSETKKYELVDSEAQWKEVQKKQAQQAVQQASVVQSATKPQIPATPTRKSGYMNSGIETGSETSFAHTRRRHRRSHRSSSPDKRISELKKHLDFDLIETTGMSVEELKEIPYVQVETTVESGIKAGRIRHSSSVKSGRLATPQEQRGKTCNPNSDIKVSEFGLTNADSPPPPYSPLVNDKLKPTVAHKPVMSNLGSSLATQMIRTTPLGESRGNQQSKLGIQTQAEVNQRMAKKGVPSHNELGLPASYPSPSESPDSQKLDSHHDNSDSGLGTDHQEYYKSENFSSLGYDLARNPGPGSLPLKSPTPFSNEPSSVSAFASKPLSNYWSNLSMAQPQVGQSWLVPENGKRSACNSLQRKVKPIRQPVTMTSTLPFHNYTTAKSNYLTEGGSNTSDLRRRLRSSSLELILGPMLASTRTRILEKEWGHQEMNINNSNRHLSRMSYGCHR